jgi:predicted transcriptional regulator
MRDAECDIQLCDSMVRKYIPTLRAEMVLRLVQRDGISQSDVAKRLGVTRAAISQYLSGKRGDPKVEISADFNTLIERWALSIAGDDTGITVCDICKCAMKKG